MAEQEKIAAFEQWALSAGWPVDKGVDGEYLDVDTRAVWSAWKAGGDASKTAASGAPTMPHHVVQLLRDMSVYAPAYGVLSAPTASMGLGSRARSILEKLAAPTSACGDCEGTGSYPGREGDIPCDYCKPSAVSGEDIDTAMQAYISESGTISSKNADLLPIDDDAMRAALETFARRAPAAARRK